MTELDLEKNTNPDQAKFRFVNPPAAPGKCIACGVYHKGNKDKFIDFGANFDYYGAVLFCQNCVEEIASVAGFVPVWLVEKLTLDLEVTKGLLSSEHKRVVALRALLDSYGYAEPDNSVSVESDVQESSGVSEEPKLRSVKSNPSK